ncbi:hypothetical protein TRIUR3_16787 [Triticum urartu]|uniref:DUF4220 domain-containing protein n=1 Tax=Triticum urartu TaxID=4572 RepID=M7ZZL8_TRIUA|nr:hypothetical protein TRIUR3_16787 [Triticum urartu]
MAGGALILASAWKQWGLQALVMLSFTLQVTLLILAEFRRLMDSGVLRAFVWSAYMLADATAIYVLGHLSVTSRSPEHELMAFWAAFLLLHLGGQDNITAYTIEDNRLWLRHLQTLAVQVAAAAYVLYESPIVGGRSSSLIRPAAILIFVVGLVKYGERVWALRDFLNGPLPDVAAYSGTLDLSGEEVYEVVEMQLSLMHDVLYTKTEVMHTWYGLCIHTIAPLGAATALALVLVGDQDHDGGHKADVVITYVLLVGAIVLEVTSALRAAFSSWTCALLVKRSFHARGAKARKTWDSLAKGLTWIRRLVHAAEWRRRYWSGSMGQHNLIRLCARSRVSRISKVARWLGLEDQWNTLAYSGPAVPVSKRIKKLVVARVLQSDGVRESSPDHVVNSRGRAALNRRPGLYQGLAWIVQDLELERSIIVWHMATDIYLGWHKEQGGQDDAALAEAVGTLSNYMLFLLAEHLELERSIIVWHMATDIYLGWHKEQGGQDDAALAEAVGTLSNYMLFLLAERPHMLPPPASRNAYVDMCYGLTGLEHGPSQDLLRRHGDALNTAPENRFAYTTRLPNSRASLIYDDLLTRGSQLGAKLVGLQEHSILEVIAQVWVEMLCFAGYRCSADSHAKQLSSGGEFLTVAALLVQYIKRHGMIKVGYCLHEISGNWEGRNGPESKEIGSHSSTTRAAASVDVLTFFAGVESVAGDQQPVARRPEQASGSGTSASRQVYRFWAGRVVLDHQYLDAWDIIKSRGHQLQQVNGIQAQQPLRVRFAQGTGRQRIALSLAHGRE